MGGLTNEQAKEKLKKYGPNKMKNMPKEMTVRRDDDWMFIMTEVLVPGDIIKIQFYGMPIPADIRIIQIIVPVHMESYFMYKEYLNYIKEMTVEQTSEDPLETSNLIFHGTSLYAGICVGMVFQTGENMLLSDISDELLATPALDDSDGGFFKQHGQLRQVLLQLQPLLLRQTS